MGVGVGAEKVYVGGWEGGEGEWVGGGYVSCLGCGEGLWVLQESTVVREGRDVPE